MTAAVVPLEVRVEQARRAAVAGNVRMTELYTARALELVAIERTDIRQAMGTANRKLRSQRMSMGLGGFVLGISEIIAEAFKPVVDLFASLGSLTQQDFALVDADQRLLDAMYAVQAGEPLTEEQRKFL